MDKIKDLFKKDIYRKIEEAIKVDQADQETVRSELEDGGTRGTSFIISIENIQHLCCPVCYAEAGRI